jgi:hypothetical protein
MDNAFGRIKGRHRKLSTIVRTYGLDFGVKMSFNILNERANKGSGFRFLFHQIEPGTLGMVIDYC